MFAVASFLKILIRSEGFDDPRMVSERRAAHVFVNGIDYSSYTRGHSVVIVDAATGIMFCRYPWHMFVKSEIENGIARPFLSCLLARGQNESSSETIHSKVCSASMFIFTQAILISYKTKFVGRLILRQRHKARLLGNGIFLIVDTSVSSHQLQLSLV